MKKTTFELSGEEAIKVARMMLDYGAMRAAYIAKIGEDVADDRDAPALVVDQTKDASNSRIIWVHEQYLRELLPGWCTRDALHEGFLTDVDKLHDGVRIPSRGVSVLLAPYAAWLAARGHTVATIARQQTASASSVEELGTARAGRIDRLREIRAGLYLSHGAVELGDLEFLLDLAMTDYDMSAGDVARNVRALLAGDDDDDARFVPELPRAPVPAKPKPKPKPLGPLVRVDAYECAACRLRNEVTRSLETNDIRTRIIAGELVDDLPVATTLCSSCEQEMTLESTKFKRAER